MATIASSKNIFSSYEGSYQIEKIETELNISESFVELKLLKLYEYRKSQEYWAEIKKSDGTIKRCSFNRGTYSWHTLN